MGRVGVVIDTSVKDSSGILSDARSDESLSTRMILDEVCYIVDNTSDGDESATVLGFGLICIPVDDGELLEGNAPVESLSLLVELLLKLLETALLNFVLLELLKIVGESELLPHPDGPLGWVILMPFDGVAIVRGELVVEVVVTFSESDESGNDVVTRRVAVVKGLITKPVGQRVNAEGGLLDEENSKDTGVDEPSHPVSPSKTGDDAGENHAHKDDGLDIIPVLPDDNGVIVQI